MKRVLITAVLLFGTWALAGEQTESFTLEVSGQKTWTIRYGIGDPTALAGENLYPGQLYLDQSLRADITGTALGFLTLEASFDDQLGPGFQHFVLKLDQAPWHGLLGDFYVGRGELGVYNKKLLGVKLAYEGEEFTVSGLAARLEGVSESRVFRGQAAQAEATYSYQDPERPWLPAPYTKNLDGLYFWDLRAPFVEGFSQVQLSLDTGPGLTGFLADYGLEYLVEVLEEEPASELRDGEYLVLRDAGDVLLLKSPPDGLLRGRIRDAIAEYNDLHDLTGPARKDYPFVLGSELERAFLAGLEAYARLQVDGEDYPFPAAGRRRYLLLPERDVIEESLVVQLLPAGEDEFRPLDDPAFADYQVDLYPEQGILKLEFPQEFFQPGAVIHVSFRYRRTGDVFMLGFSVVPGSERVYLNGEPLTKGTDYTIDYETGTLVLFMTLTEDDELRVDFERQRGGLGVVTEYERLFLGGTLSVPGYEDLEISVWRALDVGRPGPETRVMPNTHTVAALSMRGESEGWRYSLTFGASENVFPPGDNERVAAPNRINDIAHLQAPDGQYVVFAHQNGLTVYHQGEFAPYGGAQGLGGRAVRAVLALPGALLCATDAGLTVVKLTDPAPFDRVASWVRLYPDDGLPGQEAFALATDGELVYLATDEAVATFSPEQLESPEEWESWPLPEGVGRPWVLLPSRFGLLLGGEGGLFRHGDAGWTEIQEVTGPVYSLLVVGEELYVATGQGVRVLRDGSPAGWLSTRGPVCALAEFAGELWWGGEDGLFRESQPAPVLEARVTALAADQDLWVGSEASATGDEPYQLDLWRLTPAPTRFPREVTHIDGRDLGHFTDAPAALHTARGITGGLRLSREFGDWKLDLDIGTRWPGYQAIGSAGGGDNHGLGLVARYDTQTVSATLSGRWEVRDLFSAPRAALRGAVEATWRGIPTLSLSLTPTYQPREGRLEAGYRLGADWQGQGWSGGLALNGNLAGPDWYLGGKLSAQFTWQPLAELELQGRLLRPFRSRGNPGQEEASLTADLTGGTEELSWQLSLTGTASHRIGEEGWTPAAQLRMDLRWKPWTFEGGRLTPSSSLRASFTPQEWSWTVQGGGLLQMGEANLRMDVSFGQGYRPASERESRTLNLSLRWEYRGWEGVTPTLSWRRGWELLSHPRYGDKLTEKTQATLRVSWRPDAPWRNDLTVNYRGEEGGISLTNRLTWPLEVGSLSAQASATWKGGRLEGKVTVGYGQPVAEGWDVSAELGYAFGGAVGEGVKQGLFGQLSLVATF